MTAPKSVPQTDLLVEVELAMFRTETAADTLLETLRALEATALTEEAEATWSDAADVALRIEHAVETITHIMRTGADRGDF